MHQKIDLLLIARPDHSYRLYQKLLQSDILFLYYSFKLFPLWIKKIIKNPRIRYYSSNYSSCLLTSIVHIARIKFGKGNWKRFEKPTMEFHLWYSLPKGGARLIHYWPNFCIDSIIKYKEKHPNVKTCAEVFFPNERWVLDHIRPLLIQSGLPDNSMEGIERDARNLDKIMNFEDNFFVPSRFVADTYREYYPDKNYIIVPYGITKWKNYRKKIEKKSSSEIRSFVYVGTISLEKGCDILLNYFIDHDQLTLHLYGNISSTQRQFFEKYKAVRNVFFHGSVPKTQIQQIISVYDVGIHLSRYDAYSLAVGEIIGAGLPVIVSENTGNSDDVTANNLGIVTSLDPMNVKDNIERMLNNSIYNYYLNAIDNYLSKTHYSYESQMIIEYKKLLNNE